MSDKPEPTLDERVREALEDEGIQESLEALVNVPEAVQLVAQDVIVSREDIEQEIKAYLQAREDAAARLADAKSKLRKYDRVVWSMMVAALALVAIAVYIAVSEGTDAGSFEVLAVSGFVTCYLVFVAWALREDQRAKQGLAVRKIERPAAAERYEAAIADEITAAIRRAINVRLRSMSTQFSILDERGLRQLANPEREVKTDATERLRTMMASLEGGSLGISGPRGCGKTTLINRFATGRSVLPDRARRGLVVSAPVRYDAREFVLHLFARVCELVLNPQGGSPPLTRKQEQREAQIRRSGRVLVVGGLVGLAASAVVLLTDRTVPKGARETGILLLSLGGGAFAIGTIVLYLVYMAQQFRELTRMLRSKGPKVADRTPAKPEPLAKDQLEEIRYQQTLATGWSASIDLPLASKLTGESKRTLARTPWTLPEVVEAFRTFLAVLTEQSHYVVIGIDELDKIDSLEDAQRFLNDIKGVFGVKRCFYLVSVSEDAMSNFERRGMPFRDVFDSSFDAVLRVRHLSLKESREVLESRVTKLPVPFQCLCHVLAGGLPRDLIRVARELVHQHKRPGGSSALGDLARAVMGSELQGKLAAAEVTARACSGTTRDRLLTWVQSHDVDGNPDAGALRACFEAFRVPPAGAGEEVPRALALELMAFDFFAATVQEFFARDPATLEAFLGDGKDPPDLCAKASAALETLAAARRQFAMSPALAVAGVAAFRTQTDMPSWAVPEGLATANGKPAALMGAG